MGSKPVGLSASRGAAILDLNPWTTKFEVWQLIMEERQPGFNNLQGYVLPVFEGNASTRWGKAFEDSIIELAEQEAGMEVCCRERFFKSKDTDFITCHIDGLYEYKAGMYNLHEGKTTTEWSFRQKWGDPGTDRIPQQYHVQVQHQMLCTGAYEVIVSVLVFPKPPQDWEDMGYDLTKIKDNYIIFKDDISIGSVSEWSKTLAQMGFFHQYTVKRNDDLIKEMVKHYTEFWNKNVLEAIPPEPTNMDDFKRMVPNPCGTIIVDDDISAWYKEYKDISEEMRPTGQLGKRKEQLKVLILKRAKESHAELDEESADKWLFVDNQGDKCGSWSKNKKGVYTFR